MKSISILIKPTSGSCNINCRYCFYKDLQCSGDVKNTGLMSKLTMKSVIKNTLSCCDSGDHLEYAFQGGEPTLAGLEYFVDFVEYVDKINVKNIGISYSIQTNGILIDKNWCKFFKEHEFLVGLSLDGPREFNDKYRVDNEGTGTYDKIIQAKNLLEKYKVPYNILTVLTNEMAKHPDTIWGFIKDEDIDYIQFIPCMDELYSGKTEYQLTPKNFAAFYKRIFDHWIVSIMKNELHSVNFIEQLITYLSGESRGTCMLRGQCSLQYVVESSGDVYPCDFYVLRDYLGGNLNYQTIEEIFYNKNMQKFLKEGGANNKICQNCNYKNICRGGCKRMKNIMYIDRSGDYCGYRDFLDYSLPVISKIIN